MRASFLSSALVALALGLVIGCGTRTVQDRNNIVPTAVAGGDRSAAPGEDLVFDASGSADADGQLVSHVWKFPDGEREGVVVTRAFDDEGSYVVVLEVTDDFGAVGRAEILVEVAYGAPRVSASASPLSPALGEAVTFDASGSEVDTEVASITWRFGDGQQGAGAVVTHTYASPGSYRATVTVEDTEGRRGQAEIEIAAQGVDVDGIYDVVIAPSTFNCAEYTASYSETTMTITTSSGAATVTGEEGATFSGTLDGSSLLADAAWIGQTGGGCISAPVDGNLNATFDSDGHFTAFLTAFYDLPIPCQCSALFQLEGTRR